MQQWVLPGILRYWCLGQRWETNRRIGGRRHRGRGDTAKGELLVS